jgi:hypothetical protein
MGSVAQRQERRTNDNALLLVDHRRCRAWCRDRVGVPMDKFPNVVLQAKDAGHTQSQCSRLIAPADLSVPSLDFPRSTSTTQARPSDTYFAIRSTPVTSPSR